METGGGRESGASLTAGAPSTQADGSSDSAANSKEARRTVPAPSSAAMRDESESAVGSAWGAEEGSGEGVAAGESGACGDVDASIASATACTGDVAASRRRGASVDVPASRRAIVKGDVATSLAGGGANGEVARSCRSAVLGGERGDAPSGAAVISEREVSISEREMSRRSADAGDVDASWSTVVGWAAGAFEQGSERASALGATGGIRGTRSTTRRAGRATSGVERVSSSKEVGS